jgi:hypothetical protein
MIVNKGTDRSFQSRSDALILLLFEAGSLTVAAFTANGWVGWKEERTDGPS